MHIWLPLFFCCLLLTACGSEQQNTDDQPLESFISKLPNNPSICDSSTVYNDINWEAIKTNRCNWLSDYQLFFDVSSLPWQASPPGQSYELNSSLFTDFADKQRYIFIPENEQAQYKASNRIVYPTGTTIVKIFSYDQDILEVRLAIKRKFGWIFLPYIWSDQHQDAFFSYEGMVHQYEHMSYGRINYEIPSFAQCQTCHKTQNSDGESILTVIGPKPQNLNRIIETSLGNLQQLRFWQQQAMLTGLPRDLKTIDTAPNWQDESYPLEQRAKAYLDINCAHCHHDYGDAALSGLRLEYTRKSIDYSHGVCNSSHGWRGGGFDIWPSKGSVSSIPIRMRHTAAKDRMPPIGRSLVDEEAAQLVEDWIDSMTFVNCSP